MNGQRCEALRRRQFYCAMQTIANHSPRGLLPSSSRLSQRHLLSQNNFGNDSNDAEVIFHFKWIFATLCDKHPKWLLPRCSQLGMGIIDESLTAEDMQINIRPFGLRWLLGKRGECGLVSYVNLHSFDVVAFANCFSLSLLLSVSRQIHNITQVLTSVCVCIFAPLAWPNSKDLFWVLFYSFDRLTFGLGNSRYYASILDSLCVFFDPSSHLTLLTLQTFANPEACKHSTP